MSRIQRFLTSILPRKGAEDMEAQSRSWMVTCDCGFERSIWDVGGIGWRAAGNPRSLMVCPQCGKRSWHEIYRKRAVSGPEGK